MRFRAAVPTWCVAGVASALALETLRAQEATWHVRGSAANVRLVGPTQVMLKGVTSPPFATTAGEWQVHFGTDADGKPGSLRFHVPEPATVSVAIAAAGPVASTAFPYEEGLGMSLATTQRKSSWSGRRFGSPDQRDFRIVATVSAKSAQGGVGLIARYNDHGHYRFVQDRERAELRLERAMGMDTLVLARVPSPPIDDRPHELALQVVGFCVQGFYDDVLMVQVLDGAYASGSAGTWTAEYVGTFEAIAIEPPAAPRASSALVRTAEGASVTASTGASAGHFYVVELALDRPHPLLVLGESGSEAWVLQRPAAPQLVLADWRSSLGKGTLGLVPSDGLVRAELAWPSVRALRRQAALVRIVVVSPDGDVVVSRSPAVALWM